MSNHPVHLFPSFLELKKHIGYLPNWLSKLIQTLGNSPIQYILPKYQDSQIKSYITAYIPEHPNLQQILEQAQNPLMAFYSHKIITQEKSPTIVSKTTNENLIIHEITSKIDQVLPTLVDCSKPNSIIIKRPGIVSMQDLKTLTDSQIEIQKDYFQEHKFGQTDIFRTKIKPDKSTKTIVIGTKEKLKQLFKIDAIKHFHLLEIENYFLINLGSITNPENIIYQLPRNISIAKNFGLPSIYYLESAWPKNNWGEILNFIFDNISQKLPISRIEDTYLNQAYLQNHKTEQLVLV